MKFNIQFTGGLEPLNIEVPTVRLAELVAYDWALSHNEAPLTIRRTDVPVQRETQLTTDQIQAWARVRGIK